MEERNMQLDDDGKIKMKKVREDLSSETDEMISDDEIVLDVPDFAGFREEGENVGLSGEELSAKNELYEQYMAQKKSEGEELFQRAEALYAAGEWEAAGEKYLDSAAAYSGNWRAWFGVVRVQTRDLTDFSGIYDCQNAYNRALKRAGKAGKAELAETYTPRLQQKIEANAAQAETLELADRNYRDSRREGLSNDYRASRRPLTIATIVFCIALIAGLALTLNINAVSGIQILIPALIVDAVAAVGLILSLMFLRKFLSAQLAYRKNESNLSTRDGRAAAELRSENELIESIIEDFQN